MNSQYGRGNSQEKCVTTAGAELKRDFQIVEIHSPVDTVRTALCDDTRRDDQYTFVI